MEEITHAINHFAQTCAGVRDSDRALEAAIELYRKVFLLDRGEAVYLDRLESLAHFVTVDAQGKAVATRSNLIFEEREPPDWGQFACGRFMQTIDDFSMLSQLTRQCVKFFDNQESVQMVMENLSRTPAVLVPLLGEKMRPMGFIHVFRERSLGAERNPSLSAEQQELFLALSKNYIEATLDGAALRNSAELAQRRISQTAAENTTLKHNIEALNKKQVELAEESRKIGMSDMASSVLHNVGNVLNSVSVSTALISNTASKLKVAALQRAIHLLIENKALLDKFLQNDDVGRSLLGFMDNLGNDFSQKQQIIAKEAAALTSHIEHVKSVIGIQQSYAKVGGVLEKCSLLAMVEDAINMGMPQRHEEEIVVNNDFAAIPQAWFDRHKVVQILVNLMSNARNSLLICGKKRKTLNVQIIRPDRDRVRIVVVDNGIGIPAGNISQLFAQGFSTRKDGHGLGLHTSANAARELGGKLWCESQGANMGATFILELPLVIELDETSSDVREQ